jgi:hypothetical protein
MMRTLTLACNRGGEVCFVPSVAVKPPYAA